MLLGPPLLLLLLLTLIPRDGGGADDFDCSADLGEAWGGKNGLGLLFVLGRWFDI